MACAGLPLTTLVVFCCASLVQVPACPAAAELLPLTTLVVIYCGEMCRYQRALQQLSQEAERAQEAFARERAELQVTGSGVWVGYKSLSKG